MEVPQVHEIPQVVPQRSFSQLKEADDVLVRVEVSLYLLFGPLPAECDLPLKLVSLFFAERVFLNIGITSLLG